MSTDPIPALLAQLDPTRLRRDLYYLCQDPLPRRVVNYTRRGQNKSTLDEADDYIQAQLETAGYRVEKEPYPVQAFRRDLTKKIQWQFARPDPADLWYTAHNLYARKPGNAHPERQIVLIAHKDSQSWIASPGAYDNGVGTVVNLEIARVLRAAPTACSLTFIWCNEEHVPWGSVTAATRARERGDQIVAVFNTDSVGGKGQAEIDAGIKTNVTRYTTDEGEWLTRLMAEVNESYQIGLRQSAYRSAKPGDDDGSYINAGFLSAVANVGSMPYADPHYHQESDTAAAVDIENVLMSAKAILATALRAANLSG